MIINGNHKHREDAEQGPKIIQIREQCRKWEHMAITPEAGAQVCQAAKVLEPELNPHSHSHAKATWYAKEVSPTGRKRYRSTSPKPAPLRRTIAEGVLSL